MKTSRRKYRLLYQLEKNMELPMFLLSIFWLYLFIVDVLKGMSPLQEILFYIAWSIFIFEFLLKLFLAPRKISYLKHNWITVIALTIPALRVLRIFYAIRFLQSTRFLSSAKIVRALTSGKRFITELKEAQGPEPEPEMHAGIMIQYHNADQLAALTEFSEQLAADVNSELNAATGLTWCFHLEEPVKIQHQNPVRPSYFLDDASYAMARGPFDLMIVVTDQLLVSRKHRIEPGLSSAVARVAIISTAKLTATGRESPRLSLKSDAVRWNSAKLLLNLIGGVLGLKRSKRKNSVMAPFFFDNELKGVPSFNKQEQTVLQKRKNTLPERELKGGNDLESFVFHVLMAFRHPKEVVRPLLKNRAILLPLSLPGLATAAIAPTIILVFTAEIWDVGLNMSNDTAILFAAISILGASFYLVRIQSLFLPRKEKRILTEHLAVANSVIYLSIFLASAGLFLLLGGLMMIIENYVFPHDLMQTWPTLDKPVVSLGDQIRLATFISTIGVVTGAFAGGLESKTLIQHLSLFDEPK